MKLAIVITGLDTGGAEMMLLKVLERIDHRFSPHVISLTGIGKIGLCIRELGIPVDALGMHPGLLQPTAVHNLLRLLQRLRPDVVHTWMYHADLLGGLAARLAAVPAVAWGIRNSSLDADKTKTSTRFIVWLLARLSSRIPTKILSCSEDAVRVHAALGYAADRMVVVPNGFDLASFRPDATARVAMRAELAMDVKTPLVGLVGRFDLQKNHAGFFEAAGQLHRRLPQVHFVLAGKGVEPGNSQITAAMTIAGVEKVTHLLGLRDDIPRLMAGLDVLVSASSYGEAFPNVIGEAMACGVPCVVTDVGDSAYIVGDTGRVVPPDDMNGLAATIEELLTLPSEQRALLGERARTRIMERFDIEEVVKQYEAFYDEIAKPDRSRG